MFVTRDKSEEGRGRGLVEEGENYFSYVKPCSIQERGEGKEERDLVEDKGKLLLFKPPLS